MGDMWVRVYGGVYVCVYLMDRNRPASLLPRQPLRVLIDLRFESRMFQHRQRRRVRRRGRLLGRQLGRLWTVDAKLSSKKSV